MTDNEIIKALECCSQEDKCKECPYGAACLDDRYVSRVSKDALGLINRLKANEEKNENIIRLADKTIEKQQAEIERLEEENKSIRYCYEQAKSYNDILAESCEKNCKKFNMTTRAEARKELAERLKAQFAHDEISVSAWLIKMIIDNILEEKGGMQK